ncbi:MAG: hypothetical protein JJ992_26820, partial [Planctomycetes bacterium]|nr:hypothetical protein [Planctomycetota bacterium]
HQFDGGDRCVRPSERSPGPRIVTNVQLTVPPRFTARVIFDLSQVDQPTPAFLCPPAGSMHADGCPLSDVRHLRLFLHAAFEGQVGWNVGNAGSEDAEVVFGAWMPPFERTEPYFELPNPCAASTFAK